MSSESFNPLEYLLGMSPGSIDRKIMEHEQRLNEIRNMINDMSYDHLVIMLSILASASEDVKEAARWHGFFQGEAVLRRGNCVCGKKHDAEHDPRHGH